MEVTVNKDFITTYTKIKFSPLFPDQEKINIIDIAHSLSNLCRGNGHLKHFYSVAQHSLNCAEEAKMRGLSEKIQLACLLHDASEAYLSDITRPVKKYLPKYLDYEKALQKEIFRKYNLDKLTVKELNQVYEIDDTMLYYEFKILMDENIFDREPDILSKPDFEQREFEKIRDEFLSLFDSLIKKENYLSVGIDSCKGKWIAVALTKSDYDINKFEKIKDVCDRYKNADSIIIDIPIGLSENKEELRPDSELRKLLKGKASSVFNCPCRQSVYAKNYLEAIELNKKILGVSINPLSYAITSKIREVDMFLQENTEWKNKLTESHPEFCFMKFNNGTPIFENKTKQEGQLKRIAALSNYYSDTGKVIEKYKNDTSSKVKLDDAIDALCLAVMGIKGIENGFSTIPDLPMEDSKGIKMQIVFASSLNCSEI